METGLKEKTMKNFVWKFMDQFFTQGITTIVAIVLARILVPSDYGIVSAAIIFINICDTFAEEGFTSALIQKKDADQLDFSSIFYTALAFLTAIYFILFFSAPYISIFFGEGYELLTPILRVLCLKVPLSAFNVIQHAYISRNLMFKKFFWISSVGTLASAFIGIGMALGGMGPWALAAQYLSNAVIDIVIFMFAIKWRPSLCYSWQRTKKMLSFSINLLAAGLFDTFFEELRNIIVGHKYQSNALAFFEKGKRLPHIVVGSVNSSLMAVLYPIMSKIQDDKTRLREVVRKSVKVSTYILFPCMFGFAAVAEPFVSLLMTDKWLPCVPYVRIFCFFYAFYPAYTASLHATKAMGRSGVYAVTQASKKVVDILCLIAGIPFGVYGIAVGALVSKFFVYIINGTAANVVLGYHIRRQFLDILPNLLLSAVMYFAVTLLPVPSDHAIVVLAARCLTGCVVYFLLSIVTRNESFFFLWKIVKKKAEQLLHIKRAVKGMFRAGRALRRCSSCMASGSYRMNPTKTVVCRKDIKDAAAQESVFLYRTKALQGKLGSVDRLTSRLYRGHVGKGAKKFNGQLLMLTTSGKEAKIFDYEERKIANIYQDEHEAETDLKNRAYWADYFPIVPFEPALRGAMLVETMVDKQPYDVEDAFLSLFPNYIHYLETQKNSFIEGYCDNAQAIRFLNYLNRLEDYDELLRLLHMPSLITHGDLWPSNILYDGTAFYHIDFEHMAVRVFFFDVLMYIFSDYYQNKNSTLLDKYLQGEYDAQMEKLFRAAGCVYQRSERLLYLEVIIFVQFVERWDPWCPDEMMKEMRALMDYSKMHLTPGGRCSNSYDPPQALPAGSDAAVSWDSMLHGEDGQKGRVHRFSVAVVGVDGTGKSTLVESLGRYYGDRAYVQYMGFRSHTTLPARLFELAHGLHPLFRRLHLYTILYMLSSWHEMRHRLRCAFRQKDKLILLDRYAWEANDNAVSPFALRLSDFLFHRHFPSPGGLIYLHCPVEQSLQRKDDILDIEWFVKMKEKTDRNYMDRPDTLTIDTSANTPEQVMSMAVEYIDKLTNGQYRPTQATVH